MTADDLQLVTHAAPFPKPLDFLQTDDVGVGHRISDAFEIDLVVGAQSEPDIVADDFHSIPVQPCPECVKRSKSITLCRPGTVAAVRPTSRGAGRLILRGNSAYGSAALTRLKSDLNVTWPGS